MRVSLFLALGKSDQGLQDWAINQLRSGSWRGKGASNSATTCDFVTTVGNGNLEEELVCRLSGTEPEAISVPEAIAAFRYLLEEIERSDIRFKYVKNSEFGERVRSKPERTVNAIKELIPINSVAQKVLFAGEIDGAELPKGYTLKLEWQVKIMKDENLWLIAGAFAVLAGIAAAAVWWHDRQKGRSGIKPPSKPLFQTPSFPAPVHEGVALFGWSLERPAIPLGPGVVSEEMAALLGRALYFGYQANAKQPNGVVREGEGDDATFYLLVGVEDPDGKLARMATSFDLSVRMLVEEELINKDYFAAETDPKCFAELGINKR